MNEVTQAEQGQQEASDLVKQSRAIAIASAIAHANKHDYIANAGSNFEPHDWVVEAIASVLQATKLIGSMSDAVAKAPLLRDAAEAALIRAIEQVKDGDESLAQATVNWADLHCVDAGMRIGIHDEEPVLYVTISEADPSNPALCQFVADHLANHGHMDVEVIAEW